MSTSKKPEYLTTKIDSIKAEAPTTTVHYSNLVSDTGNNNTNNKL